MLHYAEEVPHVAASRVIRFAGNIRFNPRYPDKQSRVGVDGIEGVFSFPAQDFARIIFEHYYKKPPRGVVQPRELAGQVALAYEALRKVIAEPQADAAFFRPGNLYIQEAFIVGVLTYLRTQGTPEKWEEVLRHLGVDRGSWEFRGRPISTGGQHGRASRAAAVGAFQHVFGQNRLPAGSTELVSYALGDTGASVTLEFKDTAAGGATLHTADIVNQSILPLVGVLKSGRSLQIETSPNIGSLRLTASTRNPAYWADMTRAARSRVGFELDALANDLATQGKSGAVTVSVWYELYGGVIRQTDIIFT